MKRKKDTLAFKYLRNSKLKEQNPTADCKTQEAKNQHHGFVFRQIPARFHGGHHRRRAAP